MLVNTAGLKTVLNAIKEYIRRQIGKIKRPDWNQNGEDAQDYIKNRTHWKEEKIEKYEKLKLTSFLQDGRVHFYSLGGQIRFGGEVDFSVYPFSLRYGGDPIYSDKIPLTALFLTSLAYTSCSGMSVYDEKEQLIGHFQFDALTFTAANDKYYAPVLLEVPYNYDTVYTVVLESKTTYHKISQEYLPENVLYSSKQSLTEEQQEQARENITVTKSYQIPTRVSGDNLLVDGWAAAGGYPSGFDIIAYDIERGALPYFVADDCIFLCTGIHRSARDSIIFVSGTVDYSDLERIVYKNAYWESGTSIIHIQTMEVSQHDIEERAQTEYFYVGSYGYIYGRHYEELAGDNPKYNIPKKYPFAVVDGKFKNAVLPLFGIYEELKQIVYARTDATPDGNFKIQGLIVGDQTTPFQIIDLDIPVYIKPADGIPKSDLEQSVQTSLDKADTAISLGLTAATPGQIIKVKTVQDGKPTEWEAVSPDYTLTVTVNTQDGVTVTGQTVTVRAGDADGPVYGTAEYNGQPVSFRVADGFAYYAEVTDNLAAHFKPTTVKGVINGANAAVTLLYNDFSTIQTASDIQAALDADMDLTELVGQQITCQRGNDTLSWDVVDYDSVAKVVTLCTHDVLPDNMQIELPQALMYCEDGLIAGSYTFKQGNAQYYFTLTQAIPAGGQLRATTSEFQTYESTTATTQIESGTVSTETIDGATNLGQTGTGNLNHHDRVNNGSNNFGESGILQWLNSDSPANTPMPRLTKFSRPYVPTKAGFKADLDAEFLACIQDTTWKCSANNVYECPVSLGGIAQKGNPYTVMAKFALASDIEVFGEYGGVQDGGTVWGLYVDAEATDRIKYYNNSARKWWLRSPHWSGAANIRYVNTSGVSSLNGASNSSGVAVACKIAKSN